MTASTSPPAWMMRVPPDTLDLRVLDQGTYWVTGDATVLALRSMSTDRLTNVLSFLHRRSSELHLLAMITALRDLGMGRATGAPTGEALVHHLTGTSIATVTPEQYLETTTLVPAIRHELAAR